MADISRDFRYNPMDARILQDLLQYEATPQAIVRFSEVCGDLTDYAYWFTLGTLWVSYAGRSDLDLWKQLFRSTKASRETSLMKPSELAVLRKLPHWVTAYRAHRPGETDWIAYSLDPITAGQFARRRGVELVTEYKIRRRDIAALFLRRGEVEVLMLDPVLARRRETIRVVAADEHELQRLGGEG